MEDGWRTPDVIACLRTEQRMPDGGPGGGIEGIEIVIPSPTKSTGVVTPLIGTVATVAVLTTP